MARLPRDLSVADLERILQRRKAELQSLTRERDQLLRQLAAVENKIRDRAGRSVGSGIAPGVTRAGRAWNEASLVDTLAQVMGKVGEPMKVGDILQAVLDSGYRSNASNFRALINQTLIKERKRFANTGRGTYQFKK